MTYLDAAYTILKAAGQPLQFEEITQRALAQKLIAPQGQTPEATMGSRSYSDTKQALIACACRPAASVLPPRNSEERS
jgi:hypothetical protein